VNEEQPDGGDVRREITGILLIALAALASLSLFGSSAGAAGRFLDRVLGTLLGGAAVSVPVLVAALGVAILAERGRIVSSPRGVGVALLVLTFAAYMHLGVAPGQEIAVAREHAGGGWIGALVVRSLRMGFATTGTYVVLSVTGLVGALLATNLSLASLIARAANLAAGSLRAAYEELRDLLFVAADEEAEEDQAGVAEERIPISGTDGGAPSARVARRDERPGPSAGAPERGRDAPGEAPQRPSEGAPELSRRPGDRGAVGSEYELPPISMLRRPSRVRPMRSKRDAADKARLLEETLASFGVRARVTAVNIGPVVTRFELHPAAGVKVNKIVGLANDIALNLAAPDVRIEAPIPGKSAVGIEVPNEDVSLVTLREVLESPDYRDNGSRLPIALGKDIAGRPVVAGLDRMLHLLIAGATGSGKSVCLNALICSLLFRTRPDEVRFLLIDPKMVELSNFNGIPHLLTPVITDARAASQSLRWIVQEMEKRYEAFAEAGVKDIDRYNDLWDEEERKAGRRADGGGAARARAERTGGTRPRDLEGLAGPLPYIVVVIDELADLMMVAPVDVEDAIHRLSQMARAAGINLVVATQRPSVDVITGVIKANIPSRVAFSVSSQVDSRTILDMNGAEKLLGRGDMLFLPVGASKPIRVQGAYVSEEEVQQLVEFVRAQGKPDYREPLAELEDGGERGGGDDVDELFPEAVRVVVENSQASASLLQRKLRVGFTRAARLIDQMEERGLVSGYDGSKPRDVLITLDEYRRLFKQDG